MTPTNMARMPSAMVTLLEVVPLISGMRVLLGAGADYSGAVNTI
jgi:hypothetical protein